VARDVPHPRTPLHKRGFRGVHKIYVNTYYTSAYFPKACWNTRPYGILMYWLLLPYLEGLAAVGENSMSGP